MSSSIKIKTTHYLALVLCLFTWLLLGIGASVTSTGSSLAVPDWPLAYGQVFPPMIGGIFYEHGHRLAATLVGFIALVLAVWCSVYDRRIIGLVWLALGLVIFQGVLGGITVLWLLPKPISIMHATVAQLFFMFTVIMTQLSNPDWQKAKPTLDMLIIRRWAGALLGGWLVVLVFGAATRHYNAGVAIPDFPLIYGGLWPPSFSLPVVLHLGHRLTALSMALTAVYFVVWAYRREAYKSFRPLLKALILLIVVQVLLGGWAVWSVLEVPITIAHLMNGGLVFAVTILIYMRSLDANRETTKPGVIADVLQLGKPRISLMVLMTAMCGYGLVLLIDDAPIDWLHFFKISGAILLLSYGVNTLNQWLEIDVDGAMQRTANRPLPAGRMVPWLALVLGIVECVLALVGLAIWGGVASLWLGITVIIVYDLMYTPLKRISHINTIVGAVAGALPPVLGWAAAGGVLWDERLWALFLILFLWQFPHFLAILYINRYEYHSAGISMLSGNSENWSAARQQLLLYSFALVPASLYPSVVGFAGVSYFFFCLVLNVFLVKAALGLANKPSLAHARTLLRVSVIYLPLIFIALLGEQLIFV